MTEYDASTYGERIADVYDQWGTLPGNAVIVRYAWPSELDLMARLAGLRLRERWGGWARELFSALSGTHVSAYERAG